MEGPNSGKRNGRFLPQTISKVRTPVRKDLGVTLAPAVDESGGGPDRDGREGPIFGRTLRTLSRRTANKEEQNK